MKTLIAVLVLLAVLAVALALIWWRMEGRWRPRTITRHQAEIAALLESAGWVSNHAAGAKVYVIGFRACPDWSRYFTEEVPRLQKSGAETRLILVARRDENGQSKSTPEERSTVAELWANRSLPLLQVWQAQPADRWTAPGIPAADGDAARAAIVEQSRALVDKLQPLLKDNGLDRDRMRYPTVVWWTKDGRMKACACEAEETYRFVRKSINGKTS
jgi:hypothetical protein